MNLYVKSLLFFFKEEHKSHTTENYLQYVKKSKLLKERV
jgi:hypothetical protein